MKIVVYLAAAIYALLVAFTGIDRLQALFAMALVVVCVYPLWRYLRRHESTLPFVPAVAIVYALYFAVPALAAFPLYARFQYTTQAALSETSLLALLGVTLMLLAFYLTPPRVWSRMIPAFPDAPWSDDRARKSAVVLGALGIGALVANHAVTVPTAIAQPLDFVAQLTVLSASLLFYLQLRKRLTRIYVLALWLVLMPLQIIVDAGSGFLYPVFRDVFVLLMVYLLVKKRIPWTPLLLVVCVGLLLQTVKTDYRLTVQTATGPSQQVGSTFTNAVNYVPLVGQRLPDLLNGTALYDDARTIVNRLDNRSIFAQVVYLTPDTVPYWHGETYLWLPSKIIPRFIWPDKPAETGGQAFGHRYFLLDPQDTGTSINMPQIVEFYVNFGTIGVLLGMVVIGLLYSMLRYVFELRSDNEWSRLSVIVIYSSLLAIDSNFSLVFGNVLWWFVLLYALGRFVFAGAPEGDPAVKGRRGRRKPEPAAAHATPTPRALAWAETNGQGRTRRRPTHRGPRRVE